MKIGIISDTHDNATTIKKAVGIFNRDKVDLVIHAGDYISPFSIDALDKLKAELVGVFGNNDGDVLALREISKNKIYNPPHVLEINDKTTLITHKPDMLNALIESQRYDIIIYGHTHRVDTRDEGGTLVINPGEAGGWLTGKSTVAILDVGRADVKIIEI